ncbi:hypothetical protein A3766_28625 [Oleiphilus sp. HI0132]|nr:hypothetical protein A3766_28625 [Oleiphilus sp. HI0132]
MAIAWLLTFAMREGLQGEDLTPLLGAGGDAVSHRGTVQLREYISSFLVQRQPGILGISLQQTAFFQAASDPVAEGVNERIEFMLSGCLDPMEPPLAIGIFGVYAIEK